MLLYIFFTELDAAVASLADFAGASGGDGGYGDELYSSDESSRESDDGEYSSRSNSNSSSDSSSSSDDESDEGDLFYCFVHRMTEYSINIMLKLNEYLQVKSDLLPCAPTTESALSWSLMILLARTLMQFWPTRSSSSHDALSLLARSASGGARVRQ